MGGSGLYLTSRWLALDGRSGSVSWSSRVCRGVDGLEIVWVATLGRVYRSAVDDVGGKMTEGRVGSVYPPRFIGNNVS